MSYNVKSSLRKTSGHYTAEQLWAVFKPMTPVSQYERAQRLLKRIVTLCVALDLDEVAVAAIVWIETGAPGSGLPFRSVWWISGMNAGNLGITGDPGQNAAAQTWNTPEDAANGLMAHVVAYAYGKDWQAVWDVDELGKPQTWDERFDLVLSAFGGARLDTLEALNNRWAIDVDRNYHGKLAERANKLESQMDDPPVETPSTPEEPIPPMATYNYDNGVHPDYKNYEVADNKKYAGYIDPAQHDIKGFVIHSAYGSLVGTTGWFQGGNALTDYMVGNTLDGSALDGELRRFNNPVGGRYSHASGPVSNPIEDAAKFLELYGPNPSVINMYTTALERSCNNAGSPVVSEKEHAKRVQLIAYWANEYGRKQKAKTGKDALTCDSFPIIPTENNRSFLIYHGEINEDKRTSCPDQNVRATIDRIVADVRTLLSAWQKADDTIPPVPTDPDPQAQYAPVKVIESLQAYKDKDTAPAIVLDGGKAFVFVNDRVRAIRNTKRRQTAEDDAEVIGPVITKGTEFAVLWLFQEANGTPWYISPWWTRIPVADTERVADAA